METFEKTSAHILALADRCVKCGLCLPQCPTYNLASNENESPRGRIALIQGWLTGQLAPTETLVNHLDQCLLCRRCERVCPSQVSYGEIMDESKALLNENVKTRPSMTSRGLELLLNKKTSKPLFALLRVLQKTGLFVFAKKTKLLKLLGLQRITSYLPELTKPFKTQHYYPATQSKTSKGNIALFTGCLSKQLEPETVNASINLLNRLGYGVYVPEQQVCCGALHLHKGKKDQVTSFANTNISIFNQQDDIVAVVSLVNGCTSQLREYSQLDTENSFQSEAKDIIEFLAEITWPEDITFKALNKTIALQIPCSLQNTLRAEDKLMALLQRIPGIELPPEAIYNQCCGAAGTYFLENPKFSDAFQANALASLKQVTPDTIISSNIGCALQLKAGLAADNVPIEVIHPVVLLEAQLKLN